MTTEASDSILAVRLSQRMAEMRTNPYRVAKAAGRGIDYVRSILRGKSRDPGAAGLQAVADVLQCTPEWLLGLSDETAHVDDEVGGRLRFARKRAAMTARTLSERVGLSESAVRNQENGTNGIPRQLLIQYAEILDVSVSWLLTGTEGDSEALASARRVIVKARDDVRRFLATGDRSGLELLLYTLDGYLAK